MLTSELSDFDTDIDPIEEMRLRTWARKNYAPQDERDDTWHPIILDEMLRRDQETSAVAV